MRLSRINSRLLLLRGIWAKKVSEFIQTFGARARGFGSAGE
jgi:hypothetical protein